MTFCQVSCFAMTINFEWAKQTRFQPFILLRRSYHFQVRIFIRSSKYDSFRIFVHFNLCHFHHRVYCELTMACSPVLLICLIDRVSRPAIANVRLRFPVKPEFFWGFFSTSILKVVYRLLFQPLRFVHSTTKIMFTFLYPHFKIWFISFISIQVSWSLIKTWESAIKVFPFVME